MLAVGFAFMLKNKNRDDYYVGGRDLSSFHIGMSVVATDVGGGFSIGLGGLGFAIGLSGSWMLFTGLVGAWLSAVFLIPKVKEIEIFKKFYTIADLFEHLFNPKVAKLASLISLVGYLGFTSSQLLAGSKLASATFSSIGLQEGLLIMGIVAVFYTAIGGIKAVIYTDTVQWFILLFGLIVLALPLCYIKLGGLHTLTSQLPESFLSLSTISALDLLNWTVTIIPIWFVGMTLYQRIYACRDEKTAKKAWYIAGLLEYPLMAFMGVLIGVYAKLAYQQNLFLDFGFPFGTAIDQELGMPLLLKAILPVGVKGLVLAAFFSAILSTADSCLMAASGCLIGDFFKNMDEKKEMFYSKVATLILGALALLVALSFKNVLSLMLYSYGFMVSGLFIPIVFALLFNVKRPKAAFICMLTGGLVNIIFSTFHFYPVSLGVDANLVGLLSALMIYLIGVKFEKVH